MIQTRIDGDRKITYSDQGYAIHRIGSNDYFLTEAIDQLTDTYEYEECIPLPIDEEPVEETEE